MVLAQFFASLVCFVIGIIGLIYTIKLGYPIASSTFFGIVIQFGIGILSLLFIGWGIAILYSSLRSVDL